MFRNHYIAVAFDSEAMFHLVRVKQSAANGLRSFREDDLSGHDPEICGMSISIFGVRYWLYCKEHEKKTATKEKFGSYDPLITESVLKSI